MNEEEFARMMSRDFGEGTSTRSVHTLKLNISTYSDRFSPGIGGLVRNCSGKWVKGFTGRLRDVNSYPETELRALYCGLVLLRDMNAEGAEVYFQSERAFEEMMRFNELDFADNKLRAECRDLWTETDCRLCFDFYESSVLAEPADWLAKRGVTHNIEFETLEVPPDGMRDLFNI